MPAADHARQADDKPRPHHDQHDDRQHSCGFAPAWCHAVFPSIQPFSVMTACNGTSQGSGASAATCRSDEHTSELQSLMRTSYAVFCLKKKKNNILKIYTLDHNNHKYTALHPTEHK